MSTILAQVSDTHIREPGQLAYGRLDTAPYLSVALRTLMRMPQKPDAVILTGDLTDLGAPASTPIWPNYWPVWRCLFI